MKKITKSIITICVTIILLLSTSVFAFAVDGHDPGGDNCIYTQEGYSTRIAN